MKKKGIEIGILMIIIFDLIELISGDKDCNACFSSTGITNDKYLTWEFKSDNWVKTIICIDVDLEQVEGYSSDIHIISL